MCGVGSSVFMVSPPMSLRGSGQASEASDRSLSSLPTQGEGTTFFTLSPGVIWRFMWSLPKGEVKVFCALPRGECPGFGVLLLPGEERLRGPPTRGSVGVAVRLGEEEHHFSKNRGEAAVFGKVVRRRSESNGHDRRCQRNRNPPTWPSARSAEGQSVDYD